MKISVRLQKYSVSICLWSILCLIIAILLIISNKGFDFSDEGLYAVLANPAQKISFSPINYDILFKFINEHCHYTFDIQGLRILRIALTLVGSLFVFLGLRQLYGNEEWQGITVLDQFVFVLIIGFISSYNLAIQTPGYNEFSLIGVQLFSGSFMVLILKHKVKPLEWLLFISGILAGFILVLFAKPTGIPFIMIYSFLLLLLRKKQGKVILFLALWALIAIVVVYFPLAEKVSVINFYRVFQVFSGNSTSHSLSNLFINLSKGCIPLFLAIALGYIYASYRKQLAKKKGRSFILLSLLIILVIMFIDFRRALGLYSTIRNFYSIYFFSRVNYCLSLFFVFSFGFLVREKYTTYNLSFILLLLIPPVLFFAIYFGADGSLLITFPRAFQFLIISVYLLLPLKKIGKAMVTLSIVFFLKFFISFFVFKPYNQEAISDQKIPFNYGAGKRSVIYLDSLHYNNQKIFNTAVYAYNTPYIVGFDIMEGYVYLADKVYPGSFLWGDEDLKNYFNFKFNSPDTFILVIRRDQDEKVLPYINKYDIHLYESRQIIVYGNLENRFNFYFCKKKQR